MSARVLVLMSVLAIGCGDDDGAAPAPAEPTLEATRQERCLPAELRGARVSDAPRLNAGTEGRDEISATYVDGDDVVRVMVVLYDPAGAAEERAAEDELLAACGRRPTCEEQTISGQRARLVDLAPLGQESTNLYVDPGIRVSVVGAPGRSRAFAELVDLECLRELHAERRGPASD